MTTLDESTVVAQAAPSEDDTVRPGAQAWQLGIVTDQAGHVHLGAVVAGNESGPEYVDLLAAVGACRLSEVDLQHLAVLVHGQDLADLRRLAERCIGDVRLRTRIVELIRLSTASQSPTAPAA